MAGKIKGLHHDKKGYYRWQPPMKNGKRDGAISLGTTDYYEAVVACDEARRAWELGVAQFTGSFADALGEYLEAQRGLVEIGRKSATTHYRSENQLRKYDQEFASLKNGSEESDCYQSVKLASITKKDIENWQRWKKKTATKKLTDSTIDTYSRILQGFFTWCVENEKLETSPFSKIKMPKLKRKSAIEFYTFEERDLLLKAPPSQEIDFILHFGFFAGLRFEEINAMEADWIKGDLLVVQETDYFTPKDGESRDIPLNPQLRTFLDQYGLKSKFMFAPTKLDWHPTAEHPYRFNPKKSFKTYVEDTCQLKWRSYHALRRSFATHLAIRGERIARIADLLGDDITTTEKHYIGHIPSNNSTDCL